MRTHNILRTGRSARVSLWTGCLNRPRTPPTGGGDGQPGLQARGRRVPHEVGAGWGRGCRRRGRHPAAVPVPGGDQRGLREALQGARRRSRVSVQVSVRAGVTRQCNGAREARTLHRQPGPLPRAVQVRQIGAGCAAVLVGSADVAADGGGVGVGVGVGVGGVVAVIVGADVL